MSLEEARTFIASVPWRAVQMRPTGPANRPPESHEYVILEWREIDSEGFAALVRLIRVEGYRGRYTPPYDPSKVMENDYLEIDDHIYWFIHPNMLNRQLAKHRQHEVVAGGEARRGARQ
jgi:hypothetical protein